MRRQNQKGITLIALIITIIVMLILVGVTINVVLNGGLFKKAEEATFKTEATIVKEKIEMEKTVRVIDGNENYSEITVSNLADLDEKTREKYKNIIVVNKNGDICYNPANVTDEEKIWLEEIGIKANVNIPLSSDSILYTNGNLGILINKSELAWVCMKDTQTGLYNFGLWLTVKDNYEYNGTIYQKVILSSTYNGDGTFKEYKLFAYLEEERIILPDYNGETIELTEKINIEEYYKEIENNSIYSTNEKLINMEGIEALGNVETGIYISNNIINMGLVIDEFILTQDGGEGSISILKGNKIKVIKYETGEMIDLDLTNKNIIILESGKVLLGYYEGQNIIALMLAPTEEENIYMETEDYPLSNKVVFERIK